MFSTIESAARKTERANSRITDIIQRADASAVEYNARPEVVVAAIAGPTNWSPQSGSGPVTFAEPRVTATSKVFVSTIQPASLYASRVSYVITPGVGVTLTANNRTAYPFTPQIIIKIHI